MEASPGPKRNPDERFLTEKFLMEAAQMVYAHWIKQGANPLPLGSVAYLRDCLLDAFHDRLLLDDPELD